VLAHTSLVSNELSHITIGGTEDDTGTTDNRHRVPPIIVDIRQPRVSLNPRCEVVLPCTVSHSNSISGIDEVAELHLDLIQTDIVVERGDVLVVRESGVEQEQKREGHSIHDSLRATTIVLVPIESNLRRTKATET